MKNFRMTPKWKSVFKKQNNVTVSEPQVVENFEESSAIMQEMTELPISFILGPTPGTSRSPPVLHSSQSTIERSITNTRKKISKRSHRYEIIFFKVYKNAVRNVMRDPEKFLEHRLGPSKTYSNVRCVWNDCECRG